jgi:hypothetical protein
MRKKKKTRRIRQPNSGGIIGKLWFGEWTRNK